MFSWFKKEEKRARDRSWDALSCGPQLHGGGCDAQQLTAVTAAVNTISAAVAALPPYVYTEGADGRAEAKGHRLTRLIAHGVDATGQTWHDMIEGYVQDYLLYGNAIIEIVSDQKGLSELRYIPWGRVNVVYLASGGIAFDIMPPATATGFPQRRLLSAEVLHLKDRSADGLVGIPRLKRCSRAIESATQLDEYVTALFQRGLFPSGAIEYSGTITDAIADSIRKSLHSRYSGSMNAGEPMILSNGLTWKPLQQNTQDNEILASRRFVTEEICRVFSIPPQIIGDLSNSTYNTAAEAQRAFRQQCLAPIVSKIESLINARLLSDSFVFELDLQSLEMSNVSDRWAVYETAAKNRILTINEIRRLEGYGAIPPQSKDPA